MKRERLDDQEEDDEVDGADDHPEQVDLELGGAFLCGGQGDLAGDLTDEGEDVHGRRLEPSLRWMKIASRPTTTARTPRPFGERREDDREAADLAGGIRVAADRAARHAGEDADADAGADHAEGREAGAEVAPWSEFPPWSRWSTGFWSPR